MQVNEKIYKGIAASEGIAFGPAFLFRPVDLKIPLRAAAPMEQELKRFEEACQKAGQELEALTLDVAKRTNAGTAVIFEAHQLMVADPMLADSVRSHLEAGETIETAVQAASQEIAAMLASMDNALFAAREADMRDVGRRLLRILLGIPDTSADGLKTPAIIVSQDLTPSDTTRFRPDLVLGFCTAAGGLTSHVAILARTLGLPAIVGLGEQAVNTIPDGSQLILDGTRGELVADPSPGAVDRYKEMKRKATARLASIQTSMTREAVTADGQRIEIGANIGDADSASEAVRYGAEGVGLLRTEFLYLQYSQPPSEEQQVEAYRRVLEAMGDRPVIIRTLDIGGDKPPPYLKFDRELNPFLGWRAIRICLDDQALFKTQLRAILRAAAGQRALLMYPMISSVEELRAANALLAEARKELESAGIPFGSNIPVGIMVETPAAAMLAESLIRECDFFSLGTNDLTQYTLAVDRTNERVAALFQPLHPAVLMLIKKTIEAAHQQGKWAGMCGELAGMQKAIPILLGLGLDEFSMAARSIPEAKWLVSRFTISRAKQIAEQALNLPTAGEIEELMAGVLKEARGESKK